MRKCCKYHNRSMILFDDAYRDYNYRYMLKLGSIDRNCENGVFHDEDGLIPEGNDFSVHMNRISDLIIFTGQSKCVYALEDCYRLVQELSSVDEEEENGKDIVDITTEGDASETSGDTSSEEEESTYTESQYEDSQYTESRYEESRYTESNYDDSEYAKSQYCDSEYADSKYDDKEEKLQA